MEYNTQRGDLKFREYGRNIDKMIECVCMAEEGEKRNEAARALVGVMGQVSGMSLKDEVSLHKLWDHLMLISSFRLESAWPYPTEELEKLKVRAADSNLKRAERLPYKTSKPGRRHFGVYLEEMMRKLKEVECGEEYDVMLDLIAKQAKRSYLVWNGELGEDGIIVDAVANISSDDRVEEKMRGRSINVDADSIASARTQMNPIKKKKKKKKKI